MNLPKIDQANKVVYQRPKEKRNGTKETVYRRRKGEDTPGTAGGRQTGEPGGGEPRGTPESGSELASGTKFPQQLFEGVAKTFEVRRPDIAGKAAERKAQALEEKLREKDGVIAELAQEVMTLKKILRGNGRAGRDRRGGTTGTFRGATG
jgi:hypothetical protein